MLQWSSWKYVYINGFKESNRINVILTQEHKKKVQTFKGGKWDIGKKFNMKCLGFRKDVEKKKKIITEIKASICRKQEAAGAVILLKI